MGVSSREGVEPPDVKRIKTEEVTESDSKRPPVKLTVRLTDGIRPCQVRVVNSSLESFKKEVKEEKPLIRIPFSILTPELKSCDLVDKIKALGDDNGNISTSITGNDDYNAPTYPPRLPPLPSIKNELLPDTPCFYVKSKEEAFSHSLFEACLQRPITVIRNMTTVCDLNLEYYTTKCLVESHPNHPVEVRTQIEQNSDENWNSSMTEHVWHCTSSRSYSTVSKYAEYQASTMEEHFSSYKDPENISLADYNPKIEYSPGEQRKTIKFGTNCDLSDEKKWRPQLMELMKLPAWLRVVSAGNMLSHIGNQVLGMNTVQLYLKVPASRTPGHQENNNFCAVNINIGPGDSEWFGVPDSYWGSIQGMCKEKGMDFLHGSWWPLASELADAGIPVYRFMQKPGDIVWVNSGCVHWVQASGWCNNIAWNVGPLTHRQYKLAVDRYEWNKKQNYQSIVAMVFLSWNLARNIKITDPVLLRALKITLMHSLRQIVQTIEYVKRNNVKIRFHGRKKNEPAHYCGVCDYEVFNVLFVKENEKKHVVHCLNCIKSAIPDLSGVICLEEYRFEDLLQVYDDLKLIT